MTFSDHFSTVAANYLRFRPHYPAELFDWIAAVAPSRDRAWDCACGSGQATLPLAERFARVIATDASAEQIARAPVHSGIEWHVAPAERSGLHDASVDAIVVAQALHWFDLPRFWIELRRVAKPSAVFAAWSYGVLSTGDPGIDVPFREFHDVTVGPWWPVERGHVDMRYRSIPLPFPQLETPAIELSASWTLDQLLGYLGTWSATQRFIAATGTNPVRPFGARVRPAWGEGARRVTWPLTVLAGRVQPVILA